MENDTLLQALKKDSMSFKLSEIEEMMNEELNKDPNEMDTELVDLCAEILESTYFERSDNKQTCDNNANESKDLKKSKKIKFGKLFMIAAIIIILCAITIPVGAKFIHTDASDSIVQFFNNQFHTNLKNGNTEASKFSSDDIDIIKEIKKNGIDNVVLPSDLLTDSYSKELSQIQEDELFISIGIKFENVESDFSGSVTISKHKTDDTMYAIGQIDLSEEYDTVKQITVNGMDVLVFSGNIGCYIKYADEDTEYDIVCDENCTLERALEIAKSIEGE